MRVRLAGIFLIVLFSLSLVDAAPPSFGWNARATGDQVNAQFRGYLEQ